MRKTPHEPYLGEKKSDAARVTGQRRHLGRNRKNSVAIVSHDCRVHIGYGNLIS